MNLILSAKEIQIQLKKIISYFVFDESVKPRIDAILSKIPDTDNVDEYAQKYENETDDFIHRLAELTNYEREDTLSLVSKTNETILMTFAIRLFTIDEHLSNNLVKKLPISSDIPQFLCDCLIKYWYNYKRNGAINILNI